jgi:hypothetical protein
LYYIQACEILSLFRIFLGVRIDRVLVVLGGTGCATNSFQAA